MLLTLFSVSSIEIVFNSIEIERWNRKFLRKKNLENSKNQNLKLLKDELYEDKLIGDILRLNGFKFKKHERIWEQQ